MANTFHMKDSDGVDWMVSPHLRFQKKENGKRILQQQLFKETEKDGQKAYEVKWFDVLEVEENANDGNKSE